eukprot:gb/GECG01011438.1/.p1 GENE.gb/GECG01011438.1/~~gb/GECG01011438.1/.p1  ORF type:complete len:346 (+),score=41.40 gb/GECG01011438.1/:1-1038(+)
MSWMKLPEAVDKETSRCLETLLSPIIQRYTLLSDHKYADQEAQFIQFYNKFASRISSLSKEKLESLPKVEEDEVDSREIGRLYEKLEASKTPPRQQRTESHDEQGSFEEFFELCRMTLASFAAFLHKKNERKASDIVRTKEELPATKFKDYVISRLQTNNALIIAGDTGCGKSTQVPQYLMEAGYTPALCTQPRRVAAVSLAKRVQLECDATSISSSAGKKEPHRVSYHVRFDKRRLHTGTKGVAAEDLVYATEGILLRQLVAERATRLPYRIVCLDEVHERHVSTDFLFTILRAAVQKPFCPFKLVLMSATADLKKLSRFFHNAPVLQIPVSGLPSVAVCSRYR